MKFKDWYNEEARKLWETQDHQSLYLPAQLGNYKENAEVLEYFDNIVYLSNNKENIATDKDMDNLEKIMNDMTKIKLD